MVLFDSPIFSLDEFVEIPFNRLLNLFSEPTSENKFKFNYVDKALVEFVFLVSQRQQF